MLIMSYIGDQVWLMTSRHTLPDLFTSASADVNAKGNMGVGEGVNSIQLIDVRVEDTVHEADGGGFVGVLIRNLDVDFPVAADEGGCEGDD